MAYDEDLANRIRELLSSRRGLEEKRMFGGLAFLVNGNLAVAASGQGGLLARIPPQDSDRLLSRPYVEAMVMGGREMRGWLHIGVDGLRTKRQLQSWIARATEFAATLPAK